MILDRFALTDKVAIVTGAGKGIGKGIALAFAEAGADLVCVARTMSQIEATAVEVRNLGRKALAIPCDVRENEQVESMVNKAREEFGRIDILVNNAGGTFFRLALETSERAWESVLRENLTSVFLCSKAVASVMLQQKAGSIVNISTGASRSPSPGFASYAAAKAGVNSLTLTLAHELAPHVRVNCIIPGTIWTEGGASPLEPAKDKILAAIPLNRMGTPDDIALTAIFLASSASEWVTGRMFSIDGGMEWISLA